MQAQHRGWLQVDKPAGAAAAAMIGQLQPQRCVKLQGERPAAAAAAAGSG